MSYVSSFLMFWTPLLEVLVQGCIVPVAVLTGLLGLRPSRTDIRGASNIEHREVDSWYHEPGTQTRPSSSSCQQAGEYS